MTQPATRRAVLTTGAGALALGCVGCGSSGTGGGSSAPASPSGKAASPAPSGTATASPSGKQASPAGRELARTADIPEGGGKIFPSEKVVVTQPKKGEFKAFSAICTHEGCTVSKVMNGTIDCPCHGSRFHIADGSVAQGPAARPLPPKSIKVEENSVRLV
ncbi:iron-sulfur protein [Streptomyces bungoensis]|uniref:Cytochrome bc1 complex Rieske iron-sulfur subunit n=1 Tax=Streptomyces bungoensis TaxID=285568 RepID=A0A117RD87_9ACTN|nr:Rieske (2Fe-2S) protein [Streptomyces bungoensis]KUN84359.1 iron-sulfur protein [Streptomyces bungoensis]